MNTRKKHRKQNKSKKQRSSKKGGGITAKREKEESFTYFVQNSTLEFFKNGGNGIAVLLTLNPGIESPYISTDISTFGQPVNKLILKIILLGNPGEAIEFTRISKSRNYEIHLQTPDAFINETEIQKNIYFDTLDYLDPICPAIVYSEVFLYDRFMGLFNSFPIDDIDLQNVIYTLIYIETKVDFGIIAMEYANNTKILYDLSPNVRPNSNYELYVNMSLYLLLELALKTGYSHADFHMSNIMINRSAVDYFDGIPGKPIIIDFMPYFIFP